MLKPSGCIRSRAGVQHVGDGAALEIHDDCPVGKALSPAPVVDSDGLKRSRIAALADMALELSQYGVVAHRHGQTRQQPFADPAARRMAEQPHGFADTPSFSREGRGVRQFLDEGLLPALLVATSPASHAHFDGHRRPLDRQILQAADMPAMSGRRNRSAAGARPRAGSVCRYEPSILLKRDAAHHNPRPQGQFRFLRHAPLRQKALPKQCTARKVMQTLFSSILVQRKSLILVKFTSQAKMAPDTLTA